MTTMKELDKLAQECEECASKDSRSLDEHMDKCPQCQERKVKTEVHGKMVEAMQMMASKNEEDRSKILGARMEMIITLPEEEKITALIEMLDSLGELSQADMNKDRQDKNGPDDQDAERETGEHRDSHGEDHDKLGRGSKDEGESGDDGSDTGLWVAEEGRGQAQFTNGVLE